MPITSIFHINVNCSDLDVSRPFYENLGFQTVLDLPDLADPELAVGLALPDCAGRANIMMLDPGQPRQTRLDLLEWTQPRDDQPAYEHLARLGINRIALWTVGLDEEYTRLEADGVDFLSPPKLLGEHAKFVCFRDPDGTIIELIETYSELD